MTRTFIAAAGAAAALLLSLPALAEDIKETVCAQGTYSVPCPKVVWCPAARCGIAVARPDGMIEILYSSEEKMGRTVRRPTLAGKPMDLQNLAGRVIVFEWEDSGDIGRDGADLAVKDIVYVVMPPRNAG
ncbi:hypothetical protein [Prosthecomicrobium sp. N25]|uniref:hypothetical protein n=1 Tax=Prosthecomicrobium sp. N25 TaxID=3129254 RepID=UPI003078202F